VFVKNGTTENYQGKKVRIHQLNQLNVYPCIQIQWFKKMVFQYNYSPKMLCCTSPDARTSGVI